MHVFFTNQRTAVEVVRKPTFFKGLENKMRAELLLKKLVSVRYTGHGIHGIHEIQEKLKEWFFSPPSKKDYKEMMTTGLRDHIENKGSNGKRHEASKLEDISAEL